MITYAQGAVIYGRIMQKKKKKDVRPLIFGVFAFVAVLFLFPVFVLSVLVSIIVLFIVMYIFIKKFRERMDNKAVEFKNKLFKKKVAK